MIHSASTAHPAVTFAPVRLALNAAKGWFLRVVADMNRYADAAARAMPAQTDADSTNFSL